MLSSCALRLRTLCLWGVKGLGQSQAAHGFGVLRVACSPRPRLAAWLGHAGTAGKWPHCACGRSWQACSHAPLPACLQSAEKGSQSAWQREHTSLGRWYS